MQLFCVIRFCVYDNAVWYGMAQRTGVIVQHNSMHRPSCYWLGRWTYNDRDYEVVSSSQSFIVRVTMLSKLFTHTYTDSHVYLSLKKVGLIA